MKKKTIIVALVLLIVLLSGCTGNDSVTHGEQNKEEPTTVVDLPTAPDEVNPSDSELPGSDNMPSGSDGFVIPKEQLESGLRKAKTAAEDFCEKKYKLEEEGCYDPHIYKRIGYDVYENILTVTYFGYIFFGVSEECDTCKVTVKMKYSMSGSWEMESGRIDHEYTPKMKNIHGTINIREWAGKDSVSVGKLEKGKTIRVYAIVPKSLLIDQDYNWYCISSDWSQWVADKDNWFEIID